MAFYRPPTLLSLVAFAQLFFGCGSSPDLVLPEPGGPPSPPTPPAVSAPLYLEGPRIFQAGPSPFLLAAGDLDGDGLADLAVSNRFDSTVSLLKARTSEAEGPHEPTYDPPEAVEMGPNPAGVALADLDGDGELDLVVSNRTEARLSWRKGTGDGSFGPLQTLDVGAAPQGLLAVDLDGDGRLDLAVANVGDGTVSVLFGLGGGAFEPALTLPVGENPVALTAGDLDGDGRLDLVVSNFSSNDVSVLEQGADRTFEDQTRLPSGGNPFGLALGDLNGDGHLDLVVCNELDGQLSLYRGVGDGGFAPPTSVPTGDKPNQVVLAELDGQPGLDIAVSSEEGNSVELFLNPGGGRFEPPVTLGVGRGPVGLIPLPSGSQAPPHLVCTNFFGSGVTVLVNRGGGRFRIAPRTDLEAPPVDLTFLEGAQDPLLAVTREGRTDVSLLALTPSKRFLTRALWALSSPGNRLLALPLGRILTGLEDGLALGEEAQSLDRLPLPEAIGPLARDSTGELAAALDAQGRRLYLLGVEPDGIDLLGETELPSLARDVALFDLDGDGRLEALLLSDDGSSINAYRVDSEGGLTPAQSLGAEGGVAFVPGGDRLLLLGGSAVWEVQEGSLVRLSALPPGALQGLARDLNGDGRIDLLVVHGERQVLATLEGSADGGFLEALEYAAGGEPRAVTAGAFPGRSVQVVVGSSATPMLSTLTVR